MRDDTLLRICKVVDAFDDQAGLRIKVRIEPYDNNLTDNELPYCFPLLPKHFHIHPKEGESVLVILAHQRGIQGNRFFIGPIISQPYNLYYDPHDYQARVLLKDQDGVLGKTLPNPDDDPHNEGSSPRLSDIAIRGRKNADVVLKENELRLRCGFQECPEGDAKDSLVYNRTNPAYVQMRYKELLDRKLNTKYTTSINMVADRINLLTYESPTKFDLNNRTTLVDEENMEKIMTDAHPLPYGDELVEILKDIREILLTHTHPYSMMPPSMRVDQEIKLNNTDFEKILSKGVRIN